MFYVLSCVCDERMNTHSPLTAAVTAEGAFEQTVQSHGAHVLKHVQVVPSLGQQAAPFSLKLNMNTCNRRRNQQSYSSSHIRAIFRCETTSDEIALETGRTQGHISPKHVHDFRSEEIRNYISPKAYFRNVKTH